MGIKRWKTQSLAGCASNSKRTKPNNIRSKKKKDSKAKARSYYKRDDKSHYTKKDQPKKQSELQVERGRYPCRRYEEFHDHFLTYDQILSFLTKIQKNYPDTVELFNIGHSRQGKPMNMVFITTDNSHTSETKFAAFVEAGLKGDDLFAVSNCLYIIDYLCKNPSYIKLMDYFIVPCGNPDAYDSFVKSKYKEKNIPATQRTSRDKNNDLNGKKQRFHVPENTDPGSKEAESSIDNLPAKCKNDNLSKELERKTTYKNLKEQNDTKDCNKTNSDQKSEENKPDLKSPIQMDLSTNFPVYLGANDMRNIPTINFLDKIKLWKENYMNSCPETIALIRAIRSCQFAIKLLISLQEGGETICYPFGFCADATEESGDLKEVAKKGKCGIVGRPFQYGSIFEIRGLTYGNLIDFLKMDKSSIKYMYVMQVHKKACHYDEKRELGKLMTYGCQIMESIKRMSTAVFKTFTNMTGNRKVETECVKKLMKKK